MPSDSRRDIFLKRASFEKLITVKPAIKPRALVSMGIPTLEIVFEMSLVILIS
jgi:hypothetical protein